MPKQLVAIAPRVAELLDYTDPSIEDTQVRVAISYASPKHGSELAAFRGESPHDEDYYDDDWKLFLPRQSKKGVQFGEWNLGNQWVGTVTEVGDEIQDFQVGDRLCGYGGIRETHMVTVGKDQRLKKMPADMPWQNAVCFDPAQFALGAVRDSGLKLGDTVIVVGLGAIGQLAVQMCKLAGASLVIAVDPIVSRRETARLVGADVVMDPDTMDVGYEAKKLTNHLGADVVLETSAHWKALQQALRGLAYGGTIAYAGWARTFGEGLDLGREAHFNAGQIVFSRACSEPNREFPRWSWKRIQDECWNLLQSNQLNCKPLIEPIVSFEDSGSAYMEYVDRHPETSIKLGIVFP